MSNNIEKLEKLQIADPSTVDIKLSWYMLKRNFKPYISIGLFSFFSTFILIFIFALLAAFISIGLYGAEIIDDQQFINTLGLIIMIPALILLAAFSESGYGLAYDIMSSGDEFAQFRGAFTYFRKYWWQYTLLSLLYSLPLAVLNPFIMDLAIIDSVLLKLVIFIGFNIIGFTWYAIIGTSLPAVTAHGKVKRSLAESFILFKKNPPRFWKTWGKFYLIFYFPTYIILDIYYLYRESVSGTWWTIISVLYGAALIFSIIITTLMATLVRTRLYNSLMEKENTATDS
jgi:hypothetical protein